MSAPETIAPAGPRIVAVVVTYNRLEKLRDTLARLLAEPLDGIVVVDNASSDGTQACLAAGTDPRLTVLRLDANLGGAGGFEAGMRHVAATGLADWLVLMDDDGRPEQGAVAAFREAIERAQGQPEWDGLAAAVRYPEGAICEMNRPWVNPFWRPGTFLRVLAGGGRGAFHLPDTAYDATAPAEIDGTSFVGFFVSAAAVAKAGFPDGRLFIYGDDVLYTLGLRRAGLKLAFHPGIRFEHDCTTLAPDGRRVYNPLWKVYYNYRNGLMMYRSASGIFFWPLLLVVLPKWRSLARHYGPDRERFLALMHLAVRDALKGELGRSHAEIVAMAAGPVAGPRPAQGPT